MTIKKHKFFAVIAVLFLCVLFWSRCMKSGTEPDVRGAAYAPAGTCKDCHRAIYDSSLSTAHHLATTQANEKTLLGNFAAGANAFLFNNGQKVLVEHRDSGYYQVLYTKGIETEARRFDIAFGVTHAQTSLYWMNDVAYELPLTYYKHLQNWATSPGFSAANPNFQRLIGRDCFECHSSNISNKKDPSGNTGDYFSTAEQLEQMDRRSLVYGIDCQRCHGPAAQHVNFHLDNHAEKTAKFMVVIHSLSRQQQIDLCGQCHAGNDRRKLKSRFAFKPGDNLSDFFLETSSANDGKEADVHGNQLSLLSQSACFLQSNSLTCSSCHGGHTNAASTSKQLYSQKCMNCHSQAANTFCTVKGIAPAVLTQNCVDCHMPRRASEAIQFEQEGNGKLSSYLLTTHRIAIYDTAFGKSSLQKNGGRTPVLK